MAVSSTPRRVTVVSPRARVDVALPVESTLAELLPQLVAMTGAELPEPAPAGTVSGWALSRLGAPAFESGLTVARAGVRDGDVLYLNPRRTRTAPLLFDDVVDAIASAAEHSPTGWRRQTARRVALGVAAVAFAGLAVAVALAGPGWPWSAIGPGALALALAVGGGALSRAYGDSTAGAVLGLTGVPAAALAGLFLLPGNGFGTGAVALGLACVTAYAVLAAVAVSDRVAWFIGVAVAGAFGCLAATLTVLVGTTPVRGAAVTIALAVAVCPALPMIALRLGRLPLPRIPSDVAAFRAEENPVLGRDVIDETAAAEDALSGLLGALAVLVCAGSTVLLLGTSRYGWAAAGVAGLALALRSRAYALVAQRVVLLVFGVAVLAATAVRVALVGSLTVRLVLLAVIALVAVGCAVHATRVVGRDPSPYWSRLLDVVEFLALVGIIPLAAAVLDVYARVRSLAG